jgi:hypothetical protein
VGLGLVSSAALSAAREEANRLVAAKLFEDTGNGVDVRQDTVMWLSSSAKGTEGLTEMVALLRSIASELNNSQIVPEFMSSMNYESPLELQVTFQELSSPLVLVSLTQCCHGPQLACYDGEGASYRPHRDSAAESIWASGLLGTYLAKEWARLSSPTPLHSPRK